MSRLKPPQSRGLFVRRGLEGGTWHLRRAIPLDLRCHFDNRCELSVSLKTTDPKQAEWERKKVWAKWDEEFAAKRAMGAGAVSREQALQAVETWRRERCARAAAGPVEAVLGRWWEANGGDRPAEFTPEAFAIIEGLADQARGDLAVPGGGITGRELDLAELYYAEHPKASRALTPPLTTALLIGRLQVAAREPDRWRDIEGFDAALEDAVRVGGLTAALTPSLTAACRLPFIQAWLEVARHEEWQRQRAAAFLAALGAARADPDMIKITSAPIYKAREDDHSVSEMIAGYRADRERRYGAESTGRKYGHVFTALSEAMPSDKPIRAITRADCRRVRDLLRAIPAHMGKRYPGLSMVEAIEKAEEDNATLLAPNTVNSYVSNLIAAFNWAIQEEWCDRNPAVGLVDKSMPVLERRAFTPSELVTVFEALNIEREAQSWRWWIPALGLYTGARLSELCQLRRENVCDHKGIPYLALTIFDTAGRRVQGKRLKTDASARNVPLHPHLIAVGFLDWARSRKTDLLFPELESTRGPSHVAGRWFAAHLDRVGLSDPGLVFHSMRHGFKEAADAAGVQDSKVRALGGWAVGDVAERYGRRDYVPTLYREVKKIKFGSFSLPPAS